MTTHDAPWSMPLVFISSTTSLLCLILAVVIGGGFVKLPAWVALFPLAFLVVAALFVVRYYIVSQDAVIVQRLFWKTRLPLAGLKSAWHDPMAMTKSMRTFGNGGLFSFTGYYSNKTLGPYRAYVTDPNRAVVMDFGNSKVVVSPRVPEQFIQEITASRPLG